MRFITLFYVKDIAVKLLLLRSGGVGVFKRLGHTEAAFTGRWILEAELNENDKNDH